MNYKKIYYKIISHRLINIINKNDGYYETHHILPRSLGGKDTQDNLVRLRAKEHYTCHLLLTKMYKKGTPAYYKMVTAWNYMNSACIDHERYISKGAMYERLREAFSKAMSYHQSGDKNSQYGLIWVHNNETLETMKIGKDENIPDGWSKGRRPNNKYKVVNNKIIKNNINNNSSYFKYYSIYLNNNLEDFYKITNLKINELAVLNLFKKYVDNFDNNLFNKCDVDKSKHIINEIHYKDQIKKYTEYYKIYNKCGWEEFTRITGYQHSKPNLVNNFKKYVKEYIPQNGKPRGNVKKKKYIVDNSKAFKQCSVDGITYKTITEASRKTGIPRNTISQRLINGIFDRQKYEENCLKSRHIPVPAKNC